MYFKKMFKVITLVTSKLNELMNFLDKQVLSEGLNSTPIEGVHCYKSLTPTEKIPVIYQPSVHFVVQGLKVIMLNGERYELSPGRFMSISAEDPIICQVTQASTQAPFLCVLIDIDPYQLSELSMSLDLGDMLLQHVENNNMSGVAVGELDESLLDNVHRLLTLLDSPKDIPHLGPMLTKELFYRVLTSKHGSAVVQSCFNDSNTKKIIKIINMMKANITHPFIVEELAKEANMSLSKFHREFKKVTAVSPIQYLKKLRLTMARQLMVAHNKGASCVARLVGYESSSHFSRDYTKFFGCSPKKDAFKLRQDDA